MSGFSHTIYQTAPATRIWAFLPGSREWLLVALVVVAFYGRTARVRPERFFSRGPRTARKSGRDPAGVLRWLVDRWWFVFVGLVTAGVVAWLATSLMVARQAVVR